MKPLKNIQIKTTPQHRTQNQGQFEEADPTSKDRKIIKMRNVVDLGDQEDGRKTAKRQQEEGYDDQLLEQLDQWVENQISKKKAFNFDLIKADNKQPLDQEFNNDSGPTINQAILNQIMKPTERIQMRDDNNQQDDDVQVKFQMLKNNNMYKTLDQVRIEMNKKILNSLLFYKVTKKLDELQINRKSKSSWNIQKMDEETTQVFREQSQALKIKTLNNFKGLTEYFSNPAQYIDYDVVLTKAKHHSNRPPASFPTMIPQSQQTTHSSRALMESYSQFQTQIKEHKSLLFSMRVENNEYVQTCTKREEEISNIKRKFYQKEEKTKQGWIPDQETNRKRTLMDTIEKIRQQRDQEIKVVQKEITGLKNQIQQNNEKQNIIQKELDELRQKKRRCKMLLKDIFLKQFNESNYQLVPEGLISVIKNMRKINENAKVEYFPKFLIEESKQYLMKASQLEFEIEDIRQQQQKQNPSSMNRTPQQKVAFGPQQVLTVTNIKNQVKQMMKKNKVTIKKPVFVQGLDPLNPSQYAHVIKWENQDLEPHQAMEQIESQFKLQNVPTEQNISSHKDLNQRLVHCQQELERIQKEEQNRIMKLYQNKRNLSDVQELKMVLYCLFGQNIGDQLWYQFVVEWTDQKSINPQQILKEERGQSQRDDRSTLPQVPQHMQSKMFETYRNLTQITNVDYNFNLIQ